jgi:excisionase family DNA binding protein
MNNIPTFENEYEILTTDQIAKVLKKNLATVQRWCKTGVLPAARIEGQYLIRRADFDEWFNSRMSTSQQVVKTGENKEDIADRD